MTPRVYIDYNASSPLRVSAREAMTAHLEASASNPSSVHAEGRAGRAELETARRRIAELLGGAPSGLIFTGSASESNNMALKGAALGPAAVERSRVFTSAASHPSAIEPVRWLHERISGIDGVVLPVDAAGRLDRAALGEALDERSLLVSVIAANNETGVLEDVRALAGVVHDAGAWLHVDAAQAFGRVPLHVGDWGADLVTVSAHKLGGPRGIGALWVDEHVRLTALVHGGHQERNQRGGTEDVAGALGFAAAAQDAVDAIPAEGPRQRALVEDLWRFVRREISGAVRVGEGAKTLPNTLLTAFPGAEGETLLMGLDLAGFAASSGSACTAGSLEPSHVLLAMDVGAAVASSTLRFSVGSTTTREDIDRLCEALPAVVARARGQL